MAETDRLTLDQYREYDIGKIPLYGEARVLCGAAGFVAGCTWLVLFHWGDRGAQFWPIIVLAAAGVAVGFPIDFVRARRRLREREAVAAARWDPVVAVGVVEQVIAEASAGIRLDNNDGDTAWFLQVTEDQILCVWAWADDATEHVEMDLVPGISPMGLKISWTGKKLKPSRPKRKFKRGEREPEQCEVLNGNLEHLDELLVKPSDANRKPSLGHKRTARGTTTKLAAEIESLGFYKYIPSDQIDEAKAEIDNGAHSWFLGAGRAFNADCERLAEGGVKDLIDYMRPVLQIEGCVVSDVNQSYDPENGGYSLVVGADMHTMWSSIEGKYSWDLTVIRAAELINQWLAKAGSQERVHLLNGGENGVFVLLTQNQRELIAKSALFRDRDLPGPVADFFK